MNWNSFEKKFRWLDFSGFILAIVGIQFTVYVLTVLLNTQGEVYESVLRLDMNSFFRGEVWRIFTFPFLPYRGNFFFVLITFLFTIYVSNIIYAHLGGVKTNLFIISSYLSIVIGAMIIYFTYPKVSNELIYITFSGIFLINSLIILASMLNPDREFLLFLILPVKLKWLGIFYALTFLLLLINAPTLRPIIFLSIFPLIVFTINKYRNNNILNKSRKKISSLPAISSKIKKLDLTNNFFHKCLKCKKTDVTNPELEFRIDDDGGELCIKCLKKIS